MSVWEVVKKIQYNRNDVKLCAVMGGCAFTCGTWIGLGICDQFGYENPGFDVNLLTFWGFIGGVIGGIIGSCMCITDFERDTRMYACIGVNAFLSILWAKHVFNSYKEQHEYRTLLKDDDTIILRENDYKEIQT
mmetsp:Transcript_7469/g.9273  ORF Transcript_7469/g.9273 Transcript_7469/m.9273 type:complete len:134 (-) Transcript_7469:17-418(-)